ncbi:MAG: IclR family transcriptional regulator [Granulosicoccus sp.]
MTDRKFANTLARGLSVLQAFRTDDNGLSHSELVQRTGLAPATLTRLTYTLCEVGFLSQSKNAFRLGPAALALGSVATASWSFMDLIRVEMQSLADHTGTLVALGLRDGERMLLTKTWRPDGVASIWLQPGHRLPLCGTSTGLALLAAIDESRFTTLNPDKKMQALRRTGNEQLLAHGFVIVPEDNRELKGINAVAVPFVTPEFSEPIIFLCGAMRDALSRQRMEQEVGPMLRDLVRKLELRTGSSPALAQPL